MRTYTAYTTLARPTAVLGLTVFLASACSDGPTPVAPVVPAAPSLAKGGPSLPPSNGRIYFISSLAGSYDVYSMKSDGSDRRRLTLTADEERSVHVSSDGKKLVVGVRHANGTGRELVTMNVDGTNRRVVSSNNTDTPFGYPTFSPDGRTIAYISGLASDPDTYGVWTISTSGGKVTRLTPPTQKALYPSWSPDGARIVYVGAVPGSNDYDLYIMNADGSAPQLLHDCPDGCQTPAWSSDGSKIVYIARNVGAWQVQSCNVASAVPQCGSVIPHDGVPTYLALSPDGSMLVTGAQYYQNVPGHQITISNVNGSGQTAVTPDLTSILTVAWGR